MSFTAIRGRNCPSPSPAGNSHHRFERQALSGRLGRGGGFLSRPWPSSHHRRDPPPGGGAGYAHTSFFTTEAAESLADHLAASAPDGLSYAYFVSGGSEAMEASLKLARQYFVEIGQPERHAFIARRQSYHGNTLGALAIGGNAWRRKPFLPILVPAHHVSPCYAYRGLEPGEDEASYSRRLAQELEAKILEIGPDKVAAFVAETVVGAPSAPSRRRAGYFREIRAVCDKYGVLLILDEVMSGMGRTGHLFACTEDEVVPDIVVIAKGLGAGYQPIGAMMAHRRIYDAILAGTGFFQHGHTYLGHAIACAAALEVQKVIAEEDLLPKVRRLGERLQDRLQARLGQHPHVGDIRGRGLFRGIELVADRESKEPLDSVSTHPCEAEGRGHAPRPADLSHGRDRRWGAGRSCAAGPPFICTEAEIDEIAGRLAEAIDAVIPAH